MNTLIAVIGRKRDFDDFMDWMRYSANSRSLFHHVSDMGHVEGAKLTDMIIIGSPPETAQQIQLVQFVAHCIELRNNHD